MAAWLLGAADDPSSVLARQSAYWVKALAGLPDEVTLPTDRPRSAVASYGGAAIELDWGAELHAGLAELARACDATVFMVVHAALVVLLNRLGAGSDVVVGTMVAGRSDPAAEELVGFFANTMVLRTDIGGDPSFRELLERVRTGDLLAMTHQDVPFEHLVDVVRPPRSLARHPLFQILLAWQDPDNAGPPAARSHCRDHAAAHRGRDNRREPEPR